MNAKEGQVGLEENILYSENKPREDTRKMNSNNGNKEYFVFYFCFDVNTMFLPFHHLLHVSASTWFH